MCDHIGCVITESSEESVSTVHAITTNDNRKWKYDRQNWK